MKCIDFTPENLFKLGLTPEILKNDFENWLMKNDDFIVDFDSRKIHIGKYDLKRKLNFSLALIKKELTEKGMSDAEIDEYISEMKSNLKPKLDKQLSSLPEELKKEFLIKTLISTGEKLFKINDEAVKKFSDNMLENDLVSNDFETLNQELSKPITEKINDAMIFNENLINDPLFSPQNEYMILKETFIEDIHSRTAHLKTDDDHFFHSLDIDFEDWEKTQNEEMQNTFLKLVKELNQNKIFFFGCTFDNYKHNYNKRLNHFLEYYADANEVDFIEDELQFLKNILWDIQNPLAKQDGCSSAGIDNANKASEFVSIIGIKQYLFSHNKKVNFLNDRMDYLNETPNLIAPISINEFTNDVPEEKPKVLKLKSKLLKKKYQIVRERELFEKQNENNLKLMEIQAAKKNEDNDCENNILKSTIEDYLEEFKPDINGNGYEILIAALFEYFANGKFPVLENKINFKRINKKRVGWALKELYKSEKTDNLEIEYFRFAQENINLFAKEVIVTEGFNKSNFYKAFTTNPAK